MSERQFTDDEIDDWLWRVRRLRSFNNAVRIVWQLRRQIGAMKLEAFQAGWDARSKTGDILAAYNEWKKNV